MQIKFEDLEKGDEIIIPSNSNLKYLKLISKTKGGNWKCSMGENEKTYGLPNVYTNTVKNFFESEVDLHNKIYYLHNNSNYMDMWLVKRE